MPNVGSQQSVPLTPSGHNVIFAFGVMQLIHIQLSCQIVTPGFMAPGMGSLFSCGLTRPWRTDLDRVRSRGKSASAHLHLQLGVSSCEPISASCQTLLQCPKLAVTVHRFVILTSRGFMFHSWRKPRAEAPYRSLQLVCGDEIL